MLDADEVAARLESIRATDWREQVGRRAGKLGRRKYRHLVAAVLEAEERTRPDARRDQESRLLQVATELDGLKPSQLEEVMALLHPALGPVLARWWADAKTQPYARGWARKAFRAPRHPEVSRAARMWDLRSVIQQVGPYDRDAVWLAAWATYLGSATTKLAVGPLLAAAIDAGGPSGDAVLSTLIEIGNGEHPIGVMGRHVVTGILRANRPDGWAWVERLLLAAQRQEGLRQVILEAIDEARPEAFDRMLVLIVEENLVRFAATVRAVGVWLGLPGDVTDIPKVADRVEKLRRFRTDADARRDALASGDAWTAYSALFALAMTDVFDATAAADRVLGRPDRDARAAAVRFLATVGLRSAHTRLAEVCGDEDLPVAALAASLLNVRLGPADTFERLEVLAHRLPARPRTVDGVGVEISPVALARSVIVSRMLGSLGERPVSRMLPWLADMDVTARSRYVALIGQGSSELTPELRNVVITMVGDRSSHVRNGAVKVAEGLGVRREDAPALESLLTRNASDLRRAVIVLLAKQGTDGAVASAERLWATGNTAQRDAAVELLATLGDSHPSVTQAASRLLDAGVSERQKELLDTLTGHSGTIDPGLGLYDPARRARPQLPTRAGRPFTGEVARRIVSALDDLAEDRRDTQLTVTTWQGSSEVLLADTQHWLPSPFGRIIRPSGGDDDDAASGLVLADLFRSWWAHRPDELRDGPHDALHAYAAATATTSRPRAAWPPAPAEQVTWWADLLAWQTGGSVGILRHREVVRHVLSWIVLEEATAATVAECLGAIEDALGAVPAKVIAETPPAGHHGTAMTPAEARRSYGDWRNNFADLPWLRVTDGLFARRPGLFSVDHLRRWFGIARLVDEPTPSARRRPASAGLVLAAHEAGVATDDDLFDSFFQTPLFEEMTRRRRDSLELRHPAAVVLADRLRDRVVEVERSRGELATPATALAYKVASISGAELALELLARLGRAGLKRGYLYGNEGREAVYSHLLRVSYPGPTDTAAIVARVADRLKVRNQSLVELAVFAPQWADRIEGALGWPGFADAVWWFHAHNKDYQWAVSTEVLEAWTAQTVERTELSAADRVAGAVDVAWFARCHGALDAKGWKLVHGAAKLASGGNGHRRAQLFAEAMLGEVDEAALVARISAKRHQDAVRALGLLCLPTDVAEADAAVQRRYAIMREFERGASKFGSQRQASERAAVRIGVENLARTAGYSDPQRFVWATEAAESADLGVGPVTVTVADVTATLAVDDEGHASFAVTRNGKTLSAVPAALRKNPAVTGLRDRKTALIRQAVRVRASLEAAMVRQERFSPADLDGLRAHPIVAPMLDLLVFIDEKSAALRPTRAGWTTSTGELLAPSGEMRLVHPCDLVGSGDWIGWQEQLFLHERRQPFKQVFRELYVLTDAERATAPLSHRYEGHQIQPRQALALFRRSGWLHDRESGEVSRVFHDYDLVARVTFLDGFGTPAEVELPTVATVGFTRRNSYLAEAFETVPPVVFSETMRDVDLVVSVAHAGGVDPEASASTVAMRAALVRETARAFKLDNVRDVGSHVVIEGTLGEYSVHLGSGTVHRRPGGAVCIVPVDSQRRGRLFLPFADDDPKTAEVISKVLMLANDRQIKDPTILEQLRA